MVALNPIRDADSLGSRSREKYLKVRQGTGGTKEGKGLRGESASQAGRSSWRRRGGLPGKGVLAPRLKDEGGRKETMFPR